MILSQNNKLDKSNKVGYNSFGIHFAPHKLSGKNVCPSASLGCIQSCLNTAGLGIMSNVQKARINKTKLFFDDKKNFILNLAKEIKSKVKSNEKKNLKSSFRLNLTSDVAWETVRINGKNIMEMFPDQQFYDYTKSLPRMMKYLTGKMPKNYHLTFSRSESNQTSCDIVLGCGGNVAMVFDKVLPKTYMGKKVINADEHDLRFLDPKGVICGLAAKGKAKKDDSGFVIIP